jgi:hypothetical protein
LDFSTRPFHRSAWNLQAAQVFVEVYLSSDGLTELNEDSFTIKKEFLGRLRRIHVQYCEFLQNSETNDASDAEEMEPTPLKSRRNSAAAKRRRRKGRATTVSIPVIAT